MLPQVLAVSTLWSPALQGGWYCFSQAEHTSSPTMHCVVPRHVPLSWAGCMSAGEERDIVTCYLDTHCGWFLC